MKLGDLIRVVPTRGHQIFEREIREYGRYPVVSQSGNDVEGFSDADIAVKDVPLILFGDHTCCLKYIEKPFVVGADGTKLFKIEKVDQRFAYYYLRLMMPNVSDGKYRRHFSALRELDVSSMALVEDQESVARVLTTIDRKIALNRKRIATLEAMAKEIYDYWFVQFDFPDAHGSPYKSSGGAMVYNLDLKREIPKGWDVKSINDCGEFFRGVAYSHEDEKQCGENVVLVMRGNNIKCGHIVDDSDRVFIDKAIVGQDQLMTKFSVLFAMSSGSKEHVGKTAVYYDYPAMAAYGAFCSKYVPSDSYRYFMFNFLSSSTYRAFVKRICGGTGINNMKEEYFNVPLFAFPGDIGQVRKFNELTATIYAQVYNCTQEMSKLMSLRDFLLPLLMNGQVKVG